MTALTNPVVDEIEIELIEHHAGQARVLAEAGRYNVLMCGRRWGKTELLIDLAIEALLRGERVGYWVPIYADALDVWSAIKTKLEAITESVNKSDKRITVKGGGIFEFWGLDKPGSGRGRKYHLVLIDEGAKAKPGALAEEWWKVIKATLADYEGVAWFASTPAGKDDFFEIYTEAATPENQADGWRRWNMPTSTNPYISSEWLAQAEEEYRRAGKYWIFEQEFLARPSDSGINPFGLRNLEAVSQAEPTHKGVVAWGLDLAKSTDFTVLIGLDADGAIAEFYRWNREPWPMIEARIAEYVKGQIGGGVLVSADATGVGASVCDSLEALGVMVDRFIFGAVSRQALLEDYDRAIGERFTRVLEGDHMSEMTKVEFTYRGGSVRYEVPKKGKDKVTKDDCMMAGALSWRAYRACGYPRSSTAPSTKPRATRAGWRSRPRPSSLG